MAVLSLTDARTYISGADLTGYSNKVDASGSTDELDSTTFASLGWHERVGGLSDSDGSVEGFWAAGDLTKPDDALWAGLGTNTAPVSFVPTSGAVSSIAYLTRAMQVNYKTFGQVGQLMPFSAEFKGNWPLVRGLVMHPTGTARTSTGTGTAIQVGALTSAQRLYVCLHVLSVSGTGSPTLTVKVQSNVDNTFGSPTDQITTFTGATAVGGQTGSKAGAVTDTWWRVAWTISGSSPSFLFAVTAGIGPLA